MTLYTVEKEETYFSLMDLSKRCAIEAEVIVEYVEFGVVEPEGKTRRDWRFNSSQYLRLCRALRLSQDLGINVPGVALALELLDEIEQMKLILGEI